jgi:hypothetical protein
MSEIHTPGPWVWLGKPGRSCLNSANGAVLDYAQFEGMWPARYCDEKDAANMALIAAAPDLLEMLELIVLTAKENKPARHYLEGARAAIAKARGAS